MESASAAGDSQFVRVDELTVLCSVVRGFWAGLFNAFNRVHIDESRAAVSDFCNQTRVAFGYDNHIPDICEPTCHRAGFGPFQHIHAPELTATSHPDLLARHLLVGEWIADRSPFAGIGCARPVQQP